MLCDFMHCPALLLRGMEGRCGEMKDGSINIIILIRNSGYKLNINSFPSSITVQCV